MSNELSSLFDRIQAAGSNSIDLTDQELIVATSWIDSHARHKGVWPKRLRAAVEYNCRKRERAVTELTGDATATAPQPSLSTSPPNPTQMIRSTNLPRIE
jgi:hypothetical protein